MFGYNEILNLQVHKLRNINGNKKLKLKMCVLCWKKVYFHNFVSSKVKVYYRTVNKLS